MTDTPTLADLQAQQAALQAQQASVAQQIAQTQVQPMHDASTALADPAVAALIAKLQPTHDALLDGPAKEQVWNVINVLTLCPKLVQDASDANDLLANPPAPAAEEAPAEEPVAE